MDILNFFPEDLKRLLLDSVVDFLVYHANQIAGDKIARTISQLSSQAAFHNAFDQAIKNAIRRFIAQYTTQDEDLVVAITRDSTLWQSKAVRQNLMALLRRPGSWLVNERETAIQQFADVLPQRVNRERVDRAVTFFLRCIAEELWTLPGAREIREVYSLQFQKMGAEAAQQQVALLEAQLHATTQLSTDVRQALLQLATTLEQGLLVTSPPQLVLPSVRPYHNLPQPDYIHFVGRQKELDRLGQHLASSDRAWQIVIVGIGGVGKTALALTIAYKHHKHYKDLLPEERFEAIIWISAKEEVLTIKGREKAVLIFHTLEDIYTTIAQTLEQREITRALPEEQDYLVRKALGAQRTLLIIDSLESITDERVRSFLYNLPVPTKCLITSREWVDVISVVRLTGLPLEEADKLITEEAIAREVKFDSLERQQLFKRTEGLPLPIRLSVARRASGETFDQVLRWLGDASGNLPDYCVKGQIDMVRQRDLNAWKLLLACALFDQSAGVSREALGSIADLSLADRDDGLTQLQRLSLLNRTEVDRFWILPMVQGYAEAELSGTAFGEVLLGRWLGWLLEFTQHYSVDLDFHVERASTVSFEYPHLLSAIRWCRERQRWETLLRLVEGTWFYPYLMGLYGELREILEAGVQTSKAVRDEQSEGRCMRLLGRLFWVQGQYEKALTDYLEPAKEIALRYKDDAELGKICNIQADILSYQGYMSEAEQVAVTMLEIGERLNNLEVKVWAVQRLSELASKKQQFDEALEWLDRGEEWCREQNWSRGLAWMMYLRGTALAQQGNTTAAEPFLQQSLSMAASWNEYRLVAFNEHRLTQVYSDTDRLQLALQIAKEAYALCEQLGLIVELTSVEALLRKLPGKV